MQVERNDCMDTETRKSIISEMKTIDGVDKVTSDGEVLEVHLTVDSIPFEVMKVFSDHELDAVPTGERKVVAEPAQSGWDIDLPMEFYAIIVDLYDTLDPIVESPSDMYDYAEELQSQMDEYDDTEIREIIEDVEDKWKLCQLFIEKMHPDHVEQLRLIDTEDIDPTDLTDYVNVSKSRKTSGAEFRSSSRVTDVTAVEWLETVEVGDTFKIPDRKTALVVDQLNDHVLQADTAQGTTYTFKGSDKHEVWFESDAGTELRFDVRDVQSV